MAIINHLIAKGVPTGVAAAITGGSGESGTQLTAAGTSQGAATLIAGGSVYVSVVSTSGFGIKLPLCDPNSSITIFNGGGNTLYVYGQTGEQIQGGGANNKFSVANNKSVSLTKYTTTVWGANLSA